MKEIFQNNLNQFLNFGSRFFLLIVIFKTLGVNKFSELSFVITFVTTYSQALTFGSLTYLMNTKGNETKNSLKLLLLIFFITIIFLCFILHYLLSFNFEIILIITVMSLVNAINLIIVTSEKSKGNYLIDMKVSMIQSFVILLLCVVLYFKSLEVKEVLLVLSISYLICLLINSKLLKLIMHEKQDTINIIYKKRSLYGFQDLVYLLYSNGLVLILYNFMSSEDYGYFRAILLLFLPIGILVFSISQVIISRYNEMKDKINLVIVTVIMLIFSFYIFFKDTFFLLSDIQMTTELISSYYILIAYSIFNVLNMKFSVVLIVSNLQKVRFTNSLIVSTLIIALLIVLVTLDNINIYTGPVLLTLSFIITTALNIKGTMNENRNNGG